jgi:hypothetical protein
VLGVELALDNDNTARHLWIEIDDVAFIGG